MTPRERLDELLIQDATQGLTPTEAEQLDELLAMFPDEDRGAMELVAAALDRALSGPPEPLPAHLAERLELAAAALAPAERPTPSRRAVERGGRAPYLAWAVAACLAGALVFTVVQNQRTLSAQRKESAGKLAELERAVAALQAPKPEPTVAQRRDALPRDAAARAVAFGGAKGGAAGEIVWSTDRQEGYLEVRGLPALDPAKEQYQLWIVDPAHKEPVDGGVFDVKPDGSALVRVRNPIRVTDVKLFAVTKEVAGGVVVSKRPDFELVLTPKQG